MRDEWAENLVGHMSKPMCKMVLGEILKKLDVHTYLQLIWMVRSISEAKR